MIWNIVIVASKVLIALLGTLLACYIISEVMYFLMHREDPQISFKEYKALKKVAPKKWELSWDDNYAIYYEDPDKSFCGQDVYMRTFTESLIFRFEAKKKARKKKGDRLYKAWEQDINKYQKESNIFSGTIDPRYIIMGRLDDEGLQ